jgi:hypothetical protein
MRGAEGAEIAITDADGGCSEIHRRLGQELMARQPSPAREDGRRDRARRRRSLLLRPIAERLRRKEHDETLELEVPALVLEEADEDVERAALRRGHEGADVLERQHLGEQRAGELGR